MLKSVFLVRYFLYLLDMTMRIHHILLLLTLLLTSCKGVDDIRFIGVDDFVFKGMENNKVNFSASIGVSNPSTMGFKISEINLKTSVDGVFIGTLSSSDMIKVPSRTDSAYHMNFSVDLANLISGASTLYNASHQKKVDVELRGYVKARSWFMVRKVDVNEKHLVDVPSFNK
jgi:LEA14-like dessication related protein